MADSELDLSGARILVVDDVPSNLDVLCLALEDTHYQVQVAPSGEQALAIAVESRPDLILLDVMMPEMDGFEVVDRLRNDERWRSIPIVIITAKDLTADDRQKLNGYVEHVIQKGSYTQQQILEEVRNRVASHVG